MTACDYAAQLLLMLEASGLPLPEREYRFCKRRWRFDLAYPAVRLAIEVDGGGWVRGRHHRPGGYAGDCEKGNTAVLLGWRVLHYTPDMLGQAVDEVARALGERP
jgi:very-short-patch-repair endonuclease